METRKHFQPQRTRIMQITKCVFATVLLYHCDQGPVFSQSLSVYSPTLQSITAFKGQHDARVSIGGFRSPVKDNDISLAYAVTGHWALVLNHSVREESPIHDMSYKFREVAISGGYFQPVGSNGVFEVYAGTGFGHSIDGMKMRISTWTYSGSSNTWLDFLFGGSTGHTILGTEEHSYSVNMNYHRFFVQPSIAYTTPWFDCAFACQFSGIDITHVRVIHGQSGSLEIDESIRALLLTDAEAQIQQITSFESGGLQVIAEPSLMLRTGLRFVKLQFQHTWGFRGSRGFLELSLHGRTSLSIIATLGSNKKKRDEKLSNYLNHTEPERNF